MQERLHDISDRKRSRLQALERRFGPLPPPSVKASITPKSSSDGCPVQPGMGNAEASVYARLSPLFHATEVGAHMQLCNVEDGGKGVDFVIRDFIQESGKVVRNLEDVLDSKIMDRVILLDNPAGIGKAVEKARRRAKQGQGNRSNKHLSKRQHKNIGSFSIPLQYQKFNLFIPLHEMWKQYAKQVVEENQGKILEPILLQLDLHGAFLAVVEAKINNQVGVQGIMVRETPNTLAIVIPSDSVKVIPKVGSVFVFRVNDICVTLYGNSLSKCKGSSRQA